MTQAIKKLSLMTRRMLLQAGGAFGAVSILGMSAGSVKAAKISKAAVAYQDSPKGDHRCANCRQFSAPNGCKAIDGVISPNGWCRIWAKASG